MPALVVLVFLALSATGEAGPGPTGPSSLVSSACARARFSAVCVRTLAHASPRTPTDVAIAAVSASLASVRSAASELRSAAPSPLPGPLRDCFQQLSDSADQLERTRAELSRLRATSSSSSRMQLDNACTWVSAALTNEDTCLDAAKRLEGTVREDVTGKVRALEKVTSNALYFVTHLFSSRH